MFKIFKDNNSLSIAVVNEIKKYDNIVIPSGSTPEEMYRELIDSKINLANKTFIQLDEWIGVSKKTPGSCYEMIYNDFLKYDDKIKFISIDGLRNPVEEMENIIKLIPCPDLSILGVGQNGHIGLNEPGVDLTLDYVVMNLDEKTIEIANKKYFKNKVLLKEGVTLGINYLLKSKKCIIMINDISKINIAVDILNKVESPAQYMSTKDNVEIYITSEIYDLII